MSLASSLLAPGHQSRWPSWGRLQDPSRERGPLSSSHVRALTTQRCFGVETGAFSFDELRLYQNFLVPPPELLAVL